ncbi:MAG: peptidoglycan DD-metalloendopeptidase family protein [Desulfobulbaceae bacterium]|nr:peptidoglycan DD-metalloendopeptidase family protein [Desulfobulbaceae bacterium]
MARFLSLCLVLFALLHSPPLAAVPDPFLPSSEVGARIEQRRVEIQRLRENIEEQQYLTEENQEQERAILAELEDIDRRLAERMEKVYDLNKQIGEQEAELQKLGRELADISAVKDRAMRHLMRRIRAFYPVGKVGLFGVTFSRENLPDLLIFREAFANLIRYDERILADYRQKYERLRAISQTLALEQSVLKDFLAKMRVEQEAVEAVKSERETLLENVRNQVGLRKRAMAEMRAAVGKMTASLQAEIRREENKAKDFNRFKGHLPAPASGRIVVRFGEETTNKMGIVKTSQGLSFAVADGAAARAVAPGLAIFAGYLRGYGNTVILHHGQNFFTVTARLGRIDCAKGERLKAGAIIGRAGVMAMVVDDGLSFELRQGKEAIDPAPWFADGQISFATPSAHQ